MLYRVRKLPARRQRRLVGPAALAVIGALALPATALATGFTIRVHIANHTPIAGRRWPIELTITRGRQRLSGNVRYQFMFAGVVVRTQPARGAFKFTRGVYRDQLVFPKQSIGEPLTLRFLVRTRYGTEHADWRLETRR
ncbi:MAG TPA: hypothetical protein VG228_02790 [Solirubrobacteraceae bacterium]|jgi:hypothetical protein|nr:hypothetical protein [Solirubrobacteraceae bacterium]